MTKNFPWYDSNWLDSYVDAKALIAEHCPEELERFEAGFEKLRTSPEFSTKTLPKYHFEPHLDSLKDLIRNTQTADLEKHEMLTFGRYVIHDHPLFDELQAGFIDLVSELANEPLEPSYSFMSLYNNLGACPPHMDSPEAKWTLDICIEQSESWPIHFSKVRPWATDWDEFSGDWANQILADPANEFETVLLEEGEAAFFSGSSQWHYRDRIPKKQTQNFCHLLFLHYIPEGTRELLRPENWAQIFNISVLEQVTHHHSGVSYSPVVPKSNQL